MTVDADPTEIVVPLHAEAVEVSKRDVVTGHVRVAVETQSSTQMIEEYLERRTVEVERIAIGTLTETMPEARQEGDTLIIPVVEEVIIRKFRVIEEVRVRRVVSTELHTETVPLRYQTVTITREPVVASPAESNHSTYKGTDNG